MNEITQKFENINITKPKLKLIPEKYKLAEFFAGTGSFSLGFENIGKFETIYANDIEPSSKKIYDLNFKVPLTLGDINIIQNSEIPKMDIITAGFSCQAFSIQGKQLGFNDPRSEVFWKLIDIIKYHKPKIFVIENVKNLLSHDSGNTIRIILNSLKVMNYWIKYSVLNTCEVSNIPQNRERVYIIGFLEESVYHKFTFPEVNISKRKNICELLESKVDYKYLYTPKLKCWDIINSSVTKDINTNTVY